MSMVRLVIICLLGITAQAAGAIAAWAQETEAEQLHMACLLTQDVRQRIEACTIAINRPDLKPTLRDDAYVVRASMYIKQGRFDEARDDLKAARQLDVGNAAMIDEALEKLTQMEAQAAAPGMNDNLAFMLCQNGGVPAERLSACDKVISASAGDPEKQAAAHALRAAAWADEGKYDAARGDLEDAIRLDPDQTFYPNLRARVLYYGGHYAESLRAYRSLGGGAVVRENAPLVAALEYLVGEREEASARFQTAHESGRPGNIFGFYAALIRSETDKGGPASFKDLDYQVGLEGPFGVALLSYRRGEIDSDALRAAANSLPFGQTQARCMAEFNIGHRLALMEDHAGAVLPFKTASEICDRKSLEYHASKLWLQRIG